jgi:hypothetical protein
MSQSTLDFSLTSQEHKLLENFLEPTAELQVLIPHSPEDLDIAWDQLSVCLRTMAYAERVSTMLKPVIGRFLMIAQENPEFYLRKGFPNYDKFLTNYVTPLLGLKRSALYECRMIAKNLPDLTSQEYYALGPTKAKDLAAVTKSSNSDFPELMKTANDMTVMEFKKFLEEKKLREAGETIPVVIVIQANEKVEKMWKEFIGMPEVHSKVGTENPGTILEHLIMEGYYWTAPER